MSFKKWRADLEERLALHMFNYPEPSLFIPARNNKKIEVVENEAVPSCWEVYVNGKKMYAFTGSEAHRRATAQAVIIANE